VGRRVNGWCRGRYAQLVSMVSIRGISMFNHCGGCRVRGRGSGCVIVDVVVAVVTMF